MWPCWFYTPRMIQTLSVVQVLHTPTNCNPSSVMFVIVSHSSHGCYKTENNPHTHNKSAYDIALKFAVSFSYSVVSQPGSSSLDGVLNKVLKLKDRNIKRVSQVLSASMKLETCLSYMVSDIIMVKGHSDSESERGNPLPPHGLLFPISSKGSFIWIIHRQDSKYHGFWYTMKDRSDDPSHHEQTLLPRSHY